MILRGASQRVLLPATAAGLALTLGLAACSGGDKAAPPKASPSSTPAPPTKTAPGLAPLAGGPVLAVKIDNTSSSRPRIGVTKADVVYVEPVEGGLTRLLAVFSRQLPAEVGPVRSARESDIELVANYGRVALAYSGGSSYTVKALAKGQQINLSYDASRRGFRRDPGRPAPYNVIGNTKELLARAGDSAKPKDPGFRYGPASPGGAPATSVATRWNSARVSLTWSAARKQYLVTMDGRADVSPEGTQHGASTVVVQYVTTRMSANRDVKGNPTPLVKLTGTGKATVLREGKAWQGTWNRASAAAPTSFVSGGKPIAFAPTGTVWVLLVGAGQAVQVR